MTVCIAAVAAKSKAIVLASDKAVTVGRTRPMQSDTSIRKILPVGKTGWRALVAGDPSFAQKTIRHLRNNVASTDKPTTFTDMMEQMKKSYQETRKQAVLERVLNPLLLDEELLVARKNNLLPLPDVFVQVAAKGLQQYQAGCTMLVCGFGPDGVPHIFQVSDPGYTTIHDLAGYWAIGIGESAAIERLLWLEISKRKGLERVLYEVFDAKANAEIVQGVGYEWDAEIMVFGKRSKRVPANIKRLIERVFEENTSSPFENKKFPEDWRKQLTTFANESMRQSTSETSKSKK